MEVVWGRRGQRQQKSPLRGEYCLCFSASGNGDHCFPDGCRQTSPWWRDSDISEWWGGEEETFRHPASCSPKPFSVLQTPLTSLNSHSESSESLPFALLPHSDPKRRKQWLKTPLTSPFSPAASLCRIRYPYIPEKMNLRWCDSSWDLGTALAKAT